MAIRSSSGVSLTSWSNAWAGTASTCDLWEDCEGRAQQADGFYSIDLAISHKRKVSREAWESEMLCKMPSQEGLIYKEFDLSVHVF